MLDKEQMVKDLKTALATADNETALRLLRDMKPSVDITAPLLSGIMECAIDSSNLNTIGLAREVLCNYKNALVVKSNIQNIAMSYLIANDEWHYRRIAELYQFLDYKDELTEFLAICQGNSNLEIQKIADDFGCE